MEENKMNKLSNLVINRRKELVLTQVQFAKRLNISHVSLIKLESGEEVGSAVLTKVAKYFKMQPSKIRKMLYEKED